MLVKRPVIKPETRANMGKYLDSIFSYKEGADLDSVVSEILNDRDVFLYLSTTLDPGFGLELGKMDFFDDIVIDVPYGLTLNDVHSLPALILFSYKEIIGSGANELAFHNLFPTGNNILGLYHNIPTPEEFAAQVNYALSKDTGSLNPKDLRNIKRRGF